MLQFRYDTLPSVAKLQEDFEKNIGYLKTSPSTLITIGDRQDCHMEFSNELVQDLCAIAGLDPILELAELIVAHLEKI